nr:RNA-directed DNA polymerase, eukaryota [Tanacetum cinerariifolium]
GGIEEEQLNILSEIVRSINLVPMNDRWVWSLEISGEFTVASTRKLIDEVRLPKISDMTRWVKCVPIKVNILAWKIRSDALPTRINISRRGINLENSKSELSNADKELKYPKSLLSLSEKEHDHIQYKMGGNSRGIG